MDRDQLKAWLEAGLSLDADRSADGSRSRRRSGYWVKKHGLMANGRDEARAARRADAGAARAAGCSRARLCAEIAECA